MASFYLREESEDEEEELKLVEWLPEDAAMLIEEN